MRAFAPIVLAAAVILAAPNAARARGDEGHKVVALIAERLLTPAARRKVDALLAADTDTLTAPDIASRATWADRWRESDRNGSQVRYLGTREWHFADTELDAPDLGAACFGFPALPLGASASDGVAQDCVVDKVEQFASEVGDPDESQAERILALKFLLHFVGDLHQPLHAADHHDRGGNDVHVLYGRKTVSAPLHAYWDTAIVAKLGSDPAIVADALSDDADRNLDAWSAGSPRTWAAESFTVARDVAYRLPDETEPDAHDTPSYHLDAAYERRAKTAARRQLARAGVRLASLLNAALR